MTGTLTPSENKGILTPGPESLNSSVAPRGHAELDHSLVRGAKWTALVQWAAQLLTWAGTIVVARLLTPADFGIMGMALVFAGLTSLVTEFGLGSVIVLGRHRFDADGLAQLNTIALRNGVLALLASVAAAWPLAAFYREPRLPPVVIALGTGFVLETLRLVPAALLKRHFQFRRLAFYEAVRAGTTMGVTVLLAWLGLRYWSLVGGNLIGSAVCTAMMIANRPIAFARPRRAELTAPLSLGRTLLVDRFAWYAFQTSDLVVAGRVVSSAALGAYSYAWQLASLPGTKVLAMLQRVTASVFAAVKDDRPALRRYLLVLTETAAVIIFPASLGLALVAHDFVVVVLGEKWLAAVTPLQLLAALAAASAVTAELPPILQATGHERWAMRWSASRLLVLPVAFVIAGTRWGIDGIAMAWIVFYPWFLLALVRRTLGVVELPAREYLASFWPAFSASAVMGGAVVFAHWALGPTTSPAVRLAVEVFLGAGSYLLVMATLHRREARRLAAFWRGGAAAPAGAPAGPSHPPRER